MPNREQKPGVGGGPAKPPRVDYPHDENYRPGYHEGGTRFGFFNGWDSTAPKPPAKAPKPPPETDDKG
jgi:hypothetical protein